MKVAVLGMGVMGTGFAKGLLNAGHDVIVYNRDFEMTQPLVNLGAKAVRTSAEAISEGEISIVVVTNANAVKAVLLNDETKKVLNGKMIINAATTTAEEISELSKEVGQFGGNLSEITILVGPDQLADREAQFLLGCPEESKEILTNVLETIGKCGFVGEVGNASKAEAPLLFGSMFVSMTVAYSTALALKLNIPEEIVTQQLSMVVPHAEYILPNMFARDYSQIMASVNSFKDVSITAIDAAKSVGMPTKILEDVLELYEKAEELGFGKQDGSSIVEVLLENK